MIDVILSDSDLNPDVFSWWGPLPVSAIDAWERGQALCIPKDLKHLWTIKGGGDLFESETILQPFSAADYDLIETASEIFWKKGLDPGYCVFHTGLQDSVFRKLDGSIFSLNSQNWHQMSKYQDLDEWYKVTLRAAFAEKYGLGNSI